MMTREVSSWCCAAALVLASGCASDEGNKETNDPIGTVEPGGTTTPVSPTPNGEAGGPAVINPPGTVVAPPPNPEPGTEPEPGPPGVVAPPEPEPGPNPPVPGGGAPNIPPAGGGTPPVPTPSNNAGSPAGGAAPVEPEPEPVTGTCTITPTASISENISSVGIVEFTTDVASPTAARIEFGLDTNYGMTAPVDLTSAGYRTLVLGMKPESEYHARVVVEGGAAPCASDDFTLQTGDRPTGLANIDIETNDEAALARGFMVTGTYQTGPAYILDGDGDAVWWLAGQGEVTRARMSYDGNYMWYAKGNVPEGQSKVIRVAMDGSDLEDLSQQFPRQNHDFTVLPDGRVVFIAYGDNGCDDVVEWSPDGSNRTIANTGDVLGANMCHCNAIQYSPEDDTVVVSELDNNAYIKLRLDGTVVWVLGGGQANDFTGDGATWSRQHNLHILGLDRFVFFNNGDMGQGPGSLAIELQLDLEAMTATNVWEYAAMPSIQNAIMGDVQRLWNGNTLVVYSTQGIVHEVSPEGALVQSMSWGIGGAIGYVEKRPTLYGPPPK
jgi:hypothetical protein